MSFTVDSMSMPQVDTTDDNDGAVMPVSVAAQVERKHKAKRGKKKVKKIIGVIGKAMATPFIPVSL